MWTIGVHGNWYTVLYLSHILYYVVISWQSLPPRPSVRVHDRLVYNMMTMPTRFSNAARPSCLTWEADTEHSRLELTTFGYYVGVAVFPSNLLHIGYRLEQRNSRHYTITLPNLYRIQCEVASVTRYLKYGEMTM